MKYIILALFILVLMGTKNVLSQNCDHKTMSGELEEAYQKDQELRRELMPVIGEYQKTGKGVFKLIRLSKKQDRLDEENQKLLNEWMNRCGWPDELSPKAHNTVYLILQHSNLELMKEHVNALKQKVDKGILQPDDHATMSDRIAMYEGRLQKYGTQTFQTPDNVNTVWPVVSSDSLNIWRAQVGLPTMEEYFAIAKDSMGVNMVIDPDLTLELAKRLRGE